VNHEQPNLPAASSIVAGPRDLPRARDILVDFFATHPYAARLREMEHGTRPHRHRSTRHLPAPHPLGRPRSRPVLRPHIKGPEGLPFIGGDKVHLVRGEPVTPGRWQTRNTSPTGK
jgi:hypothetical protein